MTAILIADDEGLVRAGFRMILEAQEDLEVVGEAGDGSHAIGAIRSLRPDVALVDIRMPVLDGLETVRRVVAEPGLETRVIMLTTFDLDEYVYAALAAGASGFLLKDVSPEQLVQAVRVVAAGSSLFAPTVTKRLVERFLDSRRPLSEDDDGRLSTLTAREHEVFKLIASGLSNAEIAGKLYLSDATVKTHVSRILPKLGLRDRVQAVVLAYELGLVRLGQAGRAGPGEIKRSETNGDEDSQPAATEKR